MASETSAIEAFEVCNISTFMRVSFRIADSAKSILSNIEDPKVAREFLETRFGTKQHCLQSVLMEKLRRMVLVPSIPTVMLWSTSAQS